MAAGCTEGITSDPHDSHLKPIKDCFVTPNLHNNKIVCKDTFTKDEELLEPLSKTLQQLHMSSKDDLSTEQHTSKKTKWEREQAELRSKLFEADSANVLSWNADEDKYKNLVRVGGVDISFQKDDQNFACAMLVVLSFPDLKVIHESCALVTMSEPYIPGFLAFREVNFLLERLEDVRSNHPELVPQVILVDGNGILHHRGFGLASHLGIKSGIPCIGIGKTLLCVDGLKVDKHKISKLHKKGDTFDLIGHSGKCHGRALRTSSEAVNPVYVSVGDSISLDTATELANACSIFRIPEPVRHADILSRKKLTETK